MSPILGILKRYTLRQVSQHELASSFFQLARFLDVGVPLAEALEDIGENAAGRHRRYFWLQVRQTVRSGQTLSHALRCSGVPIDGTVIAIIKSGETNAKLENACQTAFDYLSWYGALRQRLVTLLLYPVFSLCVLILVTGFLFVSVVPSIESFLVSTGEQMAWHTLLLLRVSAFLTGHFASAVLMSASVLACFAGVVLFSPGARHAVDSAILKLPLLGVVVTDLLLSRYARCCAQLYRSGIALETALQLAEEAVGNRALRTALAAARYRMISGSSLADSLSDIPAIPSVFKRLVAVGERSGQLSSVLVQLAEQQQSAADMSINRMEQLINPVLLMVMGAILLWIVVSMLGPVYNMAIVAIAGQS